MRQWNWPLWTGFVLSIIAFFSYFGFFYRFPITRDIPWVNLILFAIAIALLVMGVRRARRKVIAAIVAALGALVAVFFAAVILVLAKQIPASTGAPHVGQKAPDFTLLDSNRHPVTLSQVLSTTPRGVLLIFYRGYW